MMKKLLLPIAAVAVLSFATPSFATFWGFGGSKNWNQWGQWNQWQNDSNDWNDWGNDWKDDNCPPTWNDCDPEPCDNPVPEPATAGLSLMGLSALAVATRRRRK